MGRRHLLYLLYTSSARPPSYTPFFNAPPPPPPPFLFRKEYSEESSKSRHAADETMNHERAPSTLEEFKRLEEEKASSEGVVSSQTVEKAEDGVMEAVTGDGDLHSVKESFKGTVGSNYQKTGDK